MSVNRKKFLTISVNSKGKRQVDLNTPLDDTDFDKRIKVQVEVEDVVTTEEDRDCSDIDLVDKTVETQLKRVTWTFPSVTPHWISLMMAFFCGAAGEPTASGGKQLHPLTRSVSDDLPATGFVDCFEDNVATAEKYSGNKVESISIQIPRRKNVTMTVVTVGRFTTDMIADFELPECENLPALKGYQCKLLINGVDYTSLLWQCGLTLNNNMPTGEDAFPNSGGTDIEVLERGDQPSYSIAPQLLVRKGHTLHTAAANRTKVPVVVQLGLDAGERVVLTFPNVYLELNTKWRQFVGELNQYSTLIDATPMKDAVLKTPLKADAYLDQTEQLLLDGTEV
jgi:hypothetical protein